jgi:TP901 family phage tail tape measure protein
VTNFTARASEGFTGLTAGIRSVSGHLGQLSADFKENQAAIRGHDSVLAATRGDIASLNKQVVLATQEFGANSVQVRALKAEMANLSADARILSGDKSKLVAEGRNLSAALKEETAALKAIEAAEKAAAAEAKRLADSHVGLRDRVRDFGDSASRVGQSISIGITLPLTLAGKKVFDVGSQYETAMNVMQVATHATSDEMVKAGQVAEALGNDMRLPGVSAGDAAVAMTEMGKAGESAAQSMESARGVLELTTAANMSAGAAATITANALNAFNLEATESSRVADLLAASANATSAEITDVAAALQQSSASAAALKIPIDDLVTAIGEMANAGIKGSDAGTSLKTFMAALEPTTKQAAIAMHALGIDAFDAQGHFIGLRAVIEQAAPALAKMSDEQKQLAIKVAFGSDAMRAANIILGQGVEKYDVLHEAVNKTGAAQEMAAARSKGLSGAMDGLTSSLETVGISIYKTVAPGLEGMVRQVADLTTNVAGARPEIIQFGAAALGVFALGGPLILGIGKVATLIAGLGPGGLAITAALAGVSLLAGAYAADFGGMRETVNSFFRDYSTQVDDANKISANFGNEAGAAFKQFGLFVTQGIDTVLHALRSLFDVITTGLKVTDRLMDLDFSGAVAAWKAGQAEIDRSDADFRDRLNRRAFEFRNGYATEWNKTGNEAAVALFSGTQKGLDANPPGLLLKDALLKYKGPTIEAAASLGSAAGATAGKNAVQSWFDATHHSPFFIIHDLATALSEGFIIAGKFEGVGDLLGVSLKKGTKGKGRELAKALLSDFQDGLAGFEHAFDLISSKTGTGDLEALFNPLSRGARKNAEQVKVALKVGADAVNDYLREHQQMTKITEAELARMAERGEVSLLKLAKSFKETQDAARLLALDILIYVPKAGLEFESAMGRLKSSTIDVVPPIKGLQTVIKDSKSLENDLIDEAADKWGEYQEAVRIANENAAKAVAATAKLEHDILTSTFDDLSRQLPHSWNLIIDGMLNGSGRLGDDLLKLGVKVKGWAADVIGVADSLPGPWGRAASAVLRSADQWILFGDRVLGVLHRLDSTIPGSVSDIAEKIAGIFKSTTQQVHVSATGQIDAIGMINDALKKDANQWQAWNEDIGKQTGTAAQTTQANAAKIVTALASVGGLIASFQQGGVSGTIGGAASGFGLGSIIGGLFKHSTLGGILGAVGGGLLGVLGSLFHHKSELEKIQEQAQIAQFKDSIKISNANAIKATEESKQSILETGQKIHDLIETIQFDSKVPKSAFKAYFFNLDQLMKGFAARMKEWATSFGAETKVAAEAVKAVAEGVAATPAAFDAIAGHIHVNDAAFDSYFDDLGRLEIKFGEKAEEIPNRLEKQAERLATRLSAVVGVIPASVEGMAKIAEVQPLDPAKLHILTANSELIVNELAASAEVLDKRGVKEAAWLADRESVIFGALKESIDTQKAAVELTPPTPEQWKAVIGGAEAGLLEAVSLAQRFVSDGLVVAVSFFDKAKSLYQGIMGGIEVEKAIAELKQPEQAQWDAFSGGFASMVTAEQKALDSAIAGKSISEQLVAYTKGIVNDMASVGANMAAIASSLAGLTFGGGVGAQSLSPSFAGAGGGSFSAQSLPPSFTPAPSSPVTLAPVTIGPAQQSGGGSRSVKVEQDNSINFNAPIYLNGEAAPEEFAQRFASQFEAEMRRRRGRAMQYREDIPVYQREK